VGGKDVKEVYGGSVAPATVQGRENDHAIKLLNTIRGAGYKVAGLSPEGPEGHVWTLERRGGELQL